MQCGFEATLVVPVGALLDLLLFKCSLHVERIQYDLFPSSSAPNCHLLAESRVQGGFLQGAVTCGNHLVSLCQPGAAGVRGSQAPGHSFRSRAEVAPLLPLTCLFRGPHEGVSWKLPWPQPSRACPWWLCLQCQTKRHQANGRLSEEPPEVTQESAADICLCILVPH